MRDNSRNSKLLGLKPDSASSHHEDNISKKGLIVLSVFLKGRVTALPSEEKRLRR